VIVMLLQAAKQKAGSILDSNAPKTIPEKENLEKVSAKYKKVTLRGCLNGLGLTVHSSYRCITAVVPKGPADIAGLRVGDCIVSVDGKQPGPKEKISSVIYKDDKHIIVVQEGDMRDTEIMDTYSVDVPAGIHAGQRFQASLDGQLVLITVPLGLGPGSLLHVQLAHEPRVQKPAATAPLKDEAAMSPEVAANRAWPLYVQYSDKIQSAEEDTGKSEDKEKEIANADKLLAEELCKIWPRVCPDQGLTRSLAFRDALKKVKLWCSLRAETRAKVQAKGAGRSAKVDKLHAKIQETVIYKMAAKKIKASFGDETESTIKRTQDAQKAAYSAFDKLIQWMQGRTAAAIADDAAAPKIATL